MSAAADGPGEDPRRGASPARGLLLLAATALGALLLLVGLELALRLAGVGDAPELTSRLRYQHVWTPVLVPAARPDGTPALATADRRLPHQTVLREKPADALRVFCVGGSATAGLGYSPNVTYARQLERMLREACPEREVEVVNLGIVALSSRQVLALVEDVCRGYEPDLVVVYSGNNEFLEVHASAFLDAQRSAGARLLAALAETNLFRALAGGAARAVPPRGSELSVREMASADFRVSEAEMMETVHVAPEEVAAIVDEYEANLGAMVAAAREADTAILLMRVASNWTWRGREDLPAGWVAELLGREPGGATDADRRAALALLEAGTDPRVAGLAQWDRLYRRATLARELGRFDEARELFRASMNADPHLRRAPDALGERVEAVAAREGVPYLDTVRLLAARDEHGIVGFESFYDYVHFTPRGTLLVAAGLFRELSDLDLLAGCAPFDEEAFVAAELVRLAALEEDPLDVGRWMGLGFGTQRIADRDLWKHAAALDELDARLAADPADLRALVWRGNAGFFAPGGAEAAARDYRAALALAPDDEAVRANLAALESDRRP